jgi:hypothetical protein
VIVGNRKEPIIERVTGSVCVRERERERERERGANDAHIEYYEGPSRSRPVDRV